MMAHIKLKFHFLSELLSVCLCFSNPAFRSGLLVWWCSYEHRI